jgi:MarR family 2-MHQ and catechol resistance regulon transcriptional repressor
MKPSQEPCVQAYVLLVRSAETQHSDVSRGLMVEGLTASQFSAMKVLRIHGKLAQRDIASYILKTGGNTTALIDNLEKSGLVVRDRDTEDRRVIYVSLTADGEALFDRLYPGQLVRIREAMAGLTESEHRQLIELLKKVSPEQAEYACGTVIQK